MHGVARSALAGVAAGLLAYLSLAVNGLASIPLLTLALFAGLAALSIPALSALVERMTVGAAGFADRQAAVDGRFGRFIARPISRAERFAARPIDAIKDEHVRPAVRGAAFALIVEAILGLVLLSVMIVVGIAITVLMFFAIFHIMKAMGTASEDSKAASRDRPAIPALARGSSRMRTRALTGEEYEEFSDEKGNVVGTGHQMRTALSTEFIEYRDPRGDVIGRADERSDFLRGDFTELTSADGEKLGEVRGQKGILGDKYDEVTGPDGNPILRSEKRVGPIQGPYREHT